MNVAPVAAAAIKDKSFLTWRVCLCVSVFGMCVYECVCVSRENLRAKLMKTQTKTRATFMREKIAMREIAMRFFDL